MQTDPSKIIIFILVPTLLILSWVGFTILILLLYQKKQIAFVQSLEALKLDHEKNLLKTQLEIQEQTFQNISREIHDNIGLSLTLAKLNLNILELQNERKAKDLVQSAVELISKSISDLSDISKSLNSEAFGEQGLLNALQLEIDRLKKLNRFNIDFQVIGVPVYFTAQKELVLFRIAQEALNNVIKHAKADNIYMEVIFDQTQVRMSIKDNGQGFTYVKNRKKENSKLKAGLVNMQIRSSLIEGSMEIETELGKGTTVIVTAPINANEN